jgi:SAM-dependent methyltransferase
MMVGTRELFRYFECPRCGCVQIAEVPAGMHKYYGHNYYSFVVDEFSIQLFIKVWALKFVTFVGGLSPTLRRFIRQRHHGLDLIFLYRDIGRGRDTSILDVGAGAGKVVRNLVETGYRNVLGIDLFLAKDIYYQGRIIVRRCDIFNTDGRWDIISFHHSLEHMPEQRAVLARARELLSSDGCIIVRIPVVGGDAWQKYREHWVQLDPPRHLYLHSRRSLSIVANEAGLDVSRVYYDSSGFQFWGSELYRQDIPLSDRRSPAVNRKTPLFTARQMAEFDRRAQVANVTGTGDQIVALLVPSGGKRGSHC